MKVILAAAILLVVLGASTDPLCASTPGPEAQDMPAAVVPDEPAGDESGLPTGGDEHATVTLRERGLGPILPDEVISRLDVDMKPVRAAEGYELFWAHLTIDRIEGVRIRAMPQLHLLDSAGDSYRPNEFPWAGLAALHPSDITAGARLTVDGFGFAWFVIPEGATPASLSFNYEEVTETPVKPDKRTRRAWRKAKRAEDHSRTFEIALPPER